MTIAPKPAPASVTRFRRNGPGRFDAWCHGHRHRVLACWPLAVVAIIGLARAWPSGRR